MEATKELANKALNKSLDKVNNVGKQDHSEGRVAKLIEEQTAKLPSDIFLWTALGCLGVSTLFGLVGASRMSLFFGQFAAPILIMGLYNKVVKVEGSDRGSGSNRSERHEGSRRREAIM
jgi:hypothetical protein